MIHSLGRRNTVLTATARLFAEGSEEGAHRRGRRAERMHEGEIRFVVEDEFASMGRRNFPGDRRDERLVVAKTPAVNPAPVAVVDHRPERGGNARIGESCDGAREGVDVAGAYGKRNFEAMVAKKCAYLTGRHRRMGQRLGPNSPTHAETLDGFSGALARLLPIPSHAMRILYGVVGEGMGHAMRSRVLLEHLVAQGHEVTIMASGRAHGFLEKRFAGVRQISGLHMIYEENRVRLGRTLWSNVEEGLTGLPKNIKAYFDLLTSFAPEAVISDFESWTYLYAKSRNLPILSIDNMQIINRCTLPKSIIEGEEASFQLAKGFVKAKLPFCNEYFITTFFHPPVRKENTTLFPPILRPEILAAKRSEGEHILVYQTAEGNQGLLDALRQSPYPFHVYGMKRDLKEPLKEGNILFQPFSEVGFIEDLASCRGVIAGGGFTLMGECVYLHKPMLAVPLAKQFEQTLNARYLELVGFGKAATTLDPATIGAFLEAIPACTEKLASYTQDGNRRIEVAMDEWLDKAGAHLA
jgi:uncharacterized protein (TIGR00661 family)